MAKRLWSFLREKTGDYAITMTSLGKGGILKTQDGVLVNPNLKDPASYQREWLQANIKAASGMSPFIRITASTLRLLPVNAKWLLSLGCEVYETDIIQIVLLQPVLYHEMRKEHFQQWMSMVFRDEYPRDGIIELVNYCKLE
jgi:hypothetical protein